MKKQIIVMVEHIGDNGEWMWYGLYQNSTPTYALRHYEKEHGLTKQKVVKQGEEYYLENEDVRAYFVTVESI